MVGPAVTSSIPPLSSEVHRLSQSSESKSGSLSSGETVVQITGRATPQASHVNDTARSTFKQEIAKPDTHPLRTIATEPGVRSKPSWIKTTWVAWRIGVSKARAKEAIGTGSVRQLRQEVADIRGSQHYEGIRNAGVKKRSATETAFAIKAIQQQSSNQEADVVTYRRHDYKIPFGIDSRKDGSILVMLKTHHGVSGLGAGGFGSVTKSLRFLGNTVTLTALKTQYRNDKRDGRVLGPAIGRCEQGMFEKVEGAPYLIEVHSAGVITRRDEKGVERDKHYLELEFCDRGEFSSHAIEDMPASEGWEIYDNFLECIEYMHGQGVCHLDLKPENILLKTVVENGEERVRPRVSDLGLAQMKGDKITKGYGTLGYQAPELAQAQGRIPVDSKMDDYAAGLVALKVFFPIFDELEAMGISVPANEFAKHLNDPRSDLNEELNKLPESIQKAIRGLLEEDPAKRMSVAEARPLIQQGIAELRKNEMGR